MSNFLIFKAAFNNSATPAIGTYTVEGGTAQFNINTSLSPDYYMYAATAENPIKWFAPTAVVTDFEFVCDILTRTSGFGIAPYFTIADSNGVTKLRMESQYSNIQFMSDDTHGQSSSVICLTSPTNIGGYNIFHQFRIRVRKLTDSSSSVEVYANDNLVTSGTSPALITCGKISFLGATGAFATGETMGVKNAYVYDLSGGDVIDRGVLSNAFTRFIGWAKGIFALKSDIPTVNDATLTIQKNGTNVATFTANASTNATANITVPTKTSDLTNDSGFITSDNTKIPLAGSNQISGSLIPSTDNSIDIGSSAKNIKMLYTKGITIDGTQFLPSDYIPRSGGAVIAPYTLIGCTDNTGYLRICGGVDDNTGASIQLNGKDASGNKSCVFITAYNETQSNELILRPNGDTMLNGCLVFYPNRDNITALGDGSFRWTVVYAATGTINTSDARLKNSVKDIDDKLLDAWENIEPKQYKFNDATEKKGEKARLHTGYLAQDIQTECEKQGVNASDYGLFCYDEWEEQEEISEEIETEKDGKKVKEKRVIQPRREKGNSYALRYEEALVVECKYLRRCIAKLTARIEELEKGKEQEAGK